MGACFLLLTDLMQPSSSYTVACVASLITVIGYGFMMQLITFAGFLQCVYTACGPLAVAAHNYIFRDRPQRLAFLKWQLGCENADMHSKVLLVPKQASRIDSYVKAAQREHR